MMPHYGPRGLAALALAAGLFVGPAQAQQQPPPNRDVTVQNETDLALRELYLAPPGAADRGPDRLGSDTVAAGTTFRARLGRTRDCVFNVTAVFQDGSEETRQRVDICRNPRLVLGDPSLPTLRVQVANRSNVVLRELYAVRAAGDAPPTAGNWGPDRLGAEVVEANANFALVLRSRDCIFDLRAVYADDREEVKPRADLCQSREIAFDRSGIPRGPSRNLVLVNRHLAAVQEAYVSSSSDSDWGPDRLGSANLAPGRETPVEIQGSCEADIRIVFPNGGAEERREVDICENPRIVLRPGWVLAENLEEDGPVPAPPPADPGNALRVVNAGRLPIVEIYTPRPGEARGEDRLGADTLPVGEGIELDAPDPDACAADLVAVFRDGREVTRAGVDLCSAEEIEIR
jgi:hypothetical protein